MSKLYTMKFSSCKLELRIKIKRHNVNGMYINLYIRGPDSMVVGLTIK